MDTQPANYSFSRALPPRSRTIVPIKLNKGTASKKKKTARKPSAKATLSRLATQSQPSFKTQIVYSGLATPFPNIWRGNLEYNYRILSTQTSGLAHKSYNIRPNGLYDPDSGNNLGNIQPFGHDQLFGANLYTAAAVKKAKVKFTITHATNLDNVSSTRTNPQVMGGLDIIVPKYAIGASQATQVDSDTEALAQPGTERRTLMKFGDSTTFYRYYDIDKIFEANNQSNSNNVAAYNALPNTIISQYFHIGDYDNPMLGALQVIGWYVDISVVYTIEAYNGNYPQS